MEERRRWGQRRAKPTASEGEVLVPSSFPPIYTACGVWLELLESLHVKEVSDSFKGLSSETSRFLPRQEKHQGKKAAEGRGGSDPALYSALNDEEGFEDWSTGYDQFRNRSKKQRGTMSI